MSKNVRADLLAQINNSGMPSHLQELQRSLLVGVSQALVGNKARTEPLSLQQQDAHILASVGPAASESAINFATENCRKQGLLANVTGLNGVASHNFKLICNSLTSNDDSGVNTGYQNFSSVLRQFLLPRYAYLDFDQVVDPRHQVDAECGYPKFITPIMYRYLYDRDDMARRVVDIYADECWAADPEVRESEDENAPPTPFMEDWQNLCESTNVLQMLYRLDKLSGIGHYGALLLGVDDGADLEKPIEEERLLEGKRRSVGSKQRNLLYMRPFDEYLSFIHQYETDQMHPRYGQPKMYNLVFLDMTIDAAGASIGTRLNRRVHWTRVVHVADNLMSSLVFGVPRQQPVFNRLLDLRKIKGGSAEMFWKGGFPGLNFEVDPQFIADDPDYDEDKLRQAAENYANGLQRYITTLGIKVNSLSSQIAESPEKYVDLHVRAVAACRGVPYDIFTGTPAPKLGGAQDRLLWNGRLKRNLKKFVDPFIIRNFIDRLIAIGVLRPPISGRYYVTWPDLNTPTDEDKANLSLKWTQALSQYVASGMIHLVGPMDYLTVVLGLTPSQAQRILATAKKEDGWKKLLKVDPSQGSGINGKREGMVSKGDKQGSARTRPKKRNSADKKAEGMSS